MGPASLPTPLSPMRGRVPSSGDQGTRNLASDVFPSGPSEDFPSGSVTGARTGIRIHPPADPLGCARSQGPSLPSQTGLRQAVPQLGFPLMAFRLERSHRCPVRRPFLDATFGFRPGWPSSCRNTFAVPSSTRLASDRSLQHEGLLNRADRFRHVIPLWKNSDLSSLSAVQFSFSLRRSDKMKLRLNGRFRNRPSDDFSTFASFRCGRGWITQPLAANSCRSRSRRHNIAMHKRAATQLTIAFSEQPQPQGVELDEAFRILLVVSPRIVLEGHMRLGVERVRRLAPHHHRIALVKL